MNGSRMKPTTGTRCPTLFGKWHGIFYMPSRTILYAVAQRLSLSNLFRLKLHLHTRICWMVSRCVIFPRKVWTFVMSHPADIPRIPLHCSELRFKSPSGHDVGNRATIELKGTMHTISPGRNQVNFQILAYLLTIDLLYGTGCLSYWFC